MRSGRRSRGEDQSGEDAGVYARSEIEGSLDQRLRAGRGGAAFTDMFTDTLRRARSGRGNFI